MLLGEHSGVRCAARARCRLSRAVRAAGVETSADTSTTKSEKRLIAGGYSFRFVGVPARIERGRKRSLRVGTAGAFGGGCRERLRVCERRLSNLKSSHIRDHFSHAA